MEYMATYGWAVLIVVVIAAVIWQSGVLSIGKNVTPGKTGFSQIRPIDWSSSTTGDVTMSVINDAGTKLQLDGISSADCSGSTSGLAEDLLPAETFMLNLSGCDFAGNTGDYFRLKVTLTYTNLASSISHSSVGDIWGALE